MARPTGTKHTDESRAKMAEAKRAMWADAEKRAAFLAKRAATKAAKVPQA